MSGDSLLIETIERWFYQRAKEAPEAIRRLDERMS